VFCLLVTGYVSVGFLLAQEQFSLQFPIKFGINPNVKNLLFPTIPLHGALLNKNLNHVHFTKNNINCVHVSINGLTHGALTEIAPQITAIRLTLKTLRVKNRKIYT